MTLRAKFKLTLFEIGVVAGFAIGAIGGFFLLAWHRVRVVWRMYWNGQYGPLSTADDNAANLPEK